MSGRHVTRQLRLWAPTALAAVAAITPTTAIVLAFGSAGSGYLLHRADVAAAGAALAGGGLAVERMQGRATRRRMRRQRWEQRARVREAQTAADELRQELHDAQHTLDALRTRLVSVQDRLARVAAAGDGDRAAGQGAASVAGLPPATELSAVAGLPPATELSAVAGLPPATELSAVAGLPPATELSAVAGLPPATELSAVAGLPPATELPAVFGGSREQPGPARLVPARLVPARSLAARSAAARSAGGRVGTGSAWFETEPDTMLIPRVSATTAPAAPVPFRLPEPASVLPQLYPGRSAALPPGPRDPISGPIAIAVDLAAARDGALFTAAGHPAAPAADVDALVYAALADAESDDLTRVLEGGSARPGGRRSPGLAPGPETPAALLVAGARAVADSSALPVRGRHSA